MGATNFPMCSIQTIGTDLLIKPHMLKLKLDPKVYTYFKLEDQCLSWSAGRKIISLPGIKTALQKMCKACANTRLFCKQIEHWEGANNNTQRNWQNGSYKNALIPKNAFLV